MRFMTRPFRWVLALAGPAILATGAEPSPKHIDPQVSADSKQRTLHFLRGVGMTPPERAATTPPR